MPPKGTTNVSTRTASSTHTSSASQAQDAQMNQPPESDDDGLDNADVAQLREQIRTLVQGRRDDQGTLKLILDQLATLAAAQVPQQTT